MSPSLIQLTTNRYRRDIISVLENINKLYAAAWLIHQRDTNRTYFKKSVSNEELAVETTNSANSVKVEEKALLLHELGPEDTLGLKEVTGVILKSEPLVKAVFHIGTLQKPFTYFLYLLVEEKRYHLDYELNLQLEKACKPLVPIFVIIDNANAISNPDAKGQHFFNYVFRNGSLMYQSNDQSILRTQIDISENMVSDKIKIREWWRAQSHQFYKVAGYYNYHGAYHMALHALHQSLEMALLGLLQIKTGYHTVIPNFTRLVQMTLLFTHRIKEFFDLLEAIDNESYHLLSNVHPIEARQMLVINAVNIKRLMLTATEMFEIVEELVEELGESSH